MAYRKPMPEAWAMRVDLRGARRLVRELRRTIRPLIKEVDQIAELLNSLDADSGDHQTDREYAKIEKRYRKAYEEYRALRLDLASLAGSMED